MKSLVAPFLFLFIVFPINIFGQDTTHSSIKFGIRYSFFYNYKVIHHIPNFSMDIGQHNVYLGGQISNILKSIGDPIDSYKKNAYGINFGYRFAFWKKPTKLVPFTQFNFSIYQVSYSEHQNGSPFLTNKKSLIVENTVSIGVNFNPVKHIHFFTGVGFGSFAGFFLLIHSFTPSCYVGLEYKF